MKQVLASDAEQEATCRAGTACYPWRMRFSTCLFALSLSFEVIACSPSNGAPPDTGTGGSASGGHANGGAGNTTSSTGGTVAHGGTTSAVGGMPGAGGMTAMGGGGSTAQGGAGGSTTVSSGASVLTWVPPYHVNEAKQVLSMSFGNLGAADGISQIALQFWLTNGGSLNLDQVNESDITWFHDWARQHKVQILLCVDNNINGAWNWSEAERSFKDNGPAFAAAIVAEINKRDMDGVNLDLEGIVTATPDDQTAYVQLAQTLATALHPLGKVVTIDSFHGQWNAPNWNWWPDLLPIVDGITSMGYDQSGMTVDYQNLTDHSMPMPQKLTLGVPGYSDNWQGNTVSQQLGWIVTQGQIGVGIWDLSFGASGWYTQDVWTQLKTIKAR